jgi:hypothetical protein
MIVNFSNVSLDFLEFVAAYRSWDSITVESGYNWFTPIWRTLGQVKYLEAKWEQIDSLYSLWEFSLLKIAGDPNELSGMDRPWTHRKVGFSSR